jgi:hypothetical protein
MKESIVERKALINDSASDIDEHADVFSRLVASTATEGSNALRDEELIGNVFVLLLAGHGMWIEFMLTLAAVSNYIHYIRNYRQYFVLHDGYAIIVPGRAGKGVS